MIRQLPLSRDKERITDIASVTSPSEAGLRSVPLGLIV